MNTVQAVLAISELVSFAITLLQRAQEASAAINRASSEGRDLTADEVEQFRIIRETARRAALAEIMAGATK